MSEMQTTHTHHQHLQPHTTSTTTYGYAMTNQPAQTGGVTMSDGDVNMVHKLSLQEQMQPTATQHPNSQQQ
jgi:hypothetical protein